MKATRLALQCAVASGCLLGALTLPVTPSFARAFTDNLRVDLPTEPYTVDVPCLGPAVITDTGSLVIHTASNGNVRHFVEVANGKTVVDPLDPSLPTYTGTFAAHQTHADFVDGSRILTFTSSMTFKSSGGSVLHLLLREHLTIHADGEVRAELSNIRCH